MGKTKKAGLLARAVTCLAATIAIALGTASPAFAAGEIVNSVISVTVPTSIPCTMMADGTVVAPSGLSIVNSGAAVVVDAYTEDAMGNKVDFTLDIGGTRALSRIGGKDNAPAQGVDLPMASSKDMSLAVSRLDRQSNAPLMDAAAKDETDMLKLGFTFGLDSERPAPDGVTVLPAYRVGISSLTPNTNVPIEEIFDAKWGDPDGDVMLKYPTINPSFRAELETGRWWQPPSDLMTEEVAELVKSNQALIGDEALIIDVTPVSIAADAERNENGMYEIKLDVSPLDQYEHLSKVLVMHFDMSIGVWRVMSPLEVDFEEKTVTYEIGASLYDSYQLEGEAIITGDPAVGGTLVAHVTGISYPTRYLNCQWYRGSENPESHIVDKEIRVVYDTFRGNSFVIGENGGELSLDATETGDYNAILNVYDENTGHLIKSQNWGLNGLDYAPIQLGKGCYYYTIHTMRNTYGHELYIPEVVLTNNPYSSEIPNTTEWTYECGKDDINQTIFCVVRDEYGNYGNALTSNVVGPISSLPKTAFAVYSADDQSLDFYKRSEVPTVGEQFEGKTVTNVYTGIEDGKITPAVNTFAEERPSIDDSPFKESRTITSVSFVDNISVPSSIESWFANFENCTKGDFEKLDTSNVNTMYGLFAYSGFISLDLSSWDCKSVKDSYPSYMFYNCDNLRQVTVGDSCGRLVHNLPIHDVGGRWYNKSGIGFISGDIPTDVADTYTYRSTPPEPPKFTGTVTFSPQAEVAEDRQSTTINISYTYSPRDAVAGIVKYEVADDANGLNAREVAIDKDVLQEPVWGKYMRITIADTSGKYEGSVDSGWIGRMATEFYGRAEITDTPQNNLRPGYRVTGPILIDGQSDLSCYDIRWEIADDATGLNARPHDALNMGGYLKTEDIGKYVRIVVSAEAPYSVHVPGSIASDWVEVRGHSGGDIMRADSSVVEQGEPVGKVLISSKGEASDE